MIYLPELYTGDFDQSFSSAFRVASESATIDIPRTYKIEE